MQRALTFLYCISFLMKPTSLVRGRAFFVHRFRCCVDGEYKDKENGARIIALLSSRC
jgi:hypothetical protein